MKRAKRTIAKPAELEGVGLFTGNRVHVKLLPAPPGNGITFTRTDLPNRPRLAVNPETITSKFRRTAVITDKGELESIEHLMSALHGLGVDNIDVEVDAPEMPGMDGSSRPYVQTLRACGLQDQEEEKPQIRISDPVAFTEGDVSIVAMPSDKGLWMSYSLNYDGTFVGAQHLNIQMNDRSYESEIAPARTFCLESEVNAFLDQGLGKGASYENTLVVGKTGVLGNQLRFNDEFVRHKMLDLMGDLGALDGVLNAHIVAVKSGHTTNVKFVKKLWRAVTSGGAPEAKADTLLDVTEILKILPHRFPMLLIDKVIELDGYQRAVGIKNVTFNEPFFQGHFPGRPIMPGVLIVEAMAQLAGALLMRKSDNQAKIAVLLSLDGVKLRKTVVPGDQLRIEAETLRIKARTGEVFTRALVHGVVVAEASMRFMLADKE